MSLDGKYIDEEYATLYEREFIPRFGKHFALILWQALRLPRERPLQVLDLTISHGFPALLFLKKLDPASRVIGVSEDHLALRYLHVMAGELDNERIFGRFDDTGHLPLAAQIFDAAYINLAFDRVASVPAALREAARVVRPDCPVALVASLAGSLGELYDLVGNVLIALGEQEYLSNLMAHRLDAATADSLRELLAGAGLTGIAIHQHPFAVELPAGAYVSRDPLMERFLLPQILRELPSRLFKETLRRLSTIRAQAPFAMKLVAACAVGNAPAGPPRAASALPAGPHEEHTGRDA